MKKTRFTESQIVSILKEVEKGTSVQELGRKHAVSPATIYNWRSKYGDLTVSDLSKMKALEEENSKLKRMFADLSLVNVALKDLIEKKL